MERRKAEMTPAGMGSATQDVTLSILISATFTADPLRAPLKFWMQTLEIDARVSLAPYAQVMQELLDPDSSFAKNRNGVNVLLVRLEDWLRNGPRPPQDVEHIRNVTEELVDAIFDFRARSSTPLIVFCCPPFADLSSECRARVDQAYSRAVFRLQKLANVFCLSHADVARLYPTEVHEDPRADRIAHIPYTSEYFAALATLFARRIAAMVKPQHKVIVVDCDNTLWKGICGEDGVAGLELTPAHLEFQNMLIRQHDAGVLLCICSKNNPSDVDAVFRSRQDMPLRESHFVASRINWKPKSANLHSLAQELGLSLDSFVFVDDDPVECSEVRSGCPEVLTLRLPGTQQGIMRFLDHVWAFDRAGVTAEAKRRTQQYRENRERDAALRQGGNLEKFLESLQVVVDVSWMESEQLDRVAELIQRTNQFNLRTIRRRRDEIETLWKSGNLRILVARVRDRFGDYGLVGALFLIRRDSALELDTFVLSCRALGRNVEHRIMREIGRIAREEACTEVLLRFRESPRNKPAREFLDRAFIRFESTGDENGATQEERLFRVPVQICEALQADHSGLCAQEPTVVDRSIGAAVVHGTANTGSASNRWQYEAYRLSNLTDILGAINRRAPRASRTAVECSPPRTPLEASIAEIWAEVLGLDEIGIRDNFFELGGDSLLAVQAVARVGSVLGLEARLDQFFDTPVVADWAERLENAGPVEAPIQPVKDRAADALPSWAQQRLWFIDRLEAGSLAYHIPIALRLKGQLDRSALRQALDAVVARHESLRTVFHEVNGHPVQQVLEASGFALQLLDLTTSPDAERESRVLQQMSEELSTPFDLRRGPLIRGRLLQLSDREHVLLITVHHIVSDGWSNGVLIREAAELYKSYAAGQPDPLDPLPCQYQDYAQWQRQWLTGLRLQEQLNYWKRHLEGAPELLELPTDKPRPAVRSYLGGTVRVSLGAELTADLKALCGRAQITVAMALYAAWAIVLSRLSGQEDFVVATPVANRRRTELEGLIGFFANTLAIRVQLDGEPTVTDVLERVKRSMLDAYAHQDVPFEKVVEALQPARSLSRSPIFQVMFVLQNAVRSRTELPRLTLREEEVPLQTAQFDLLLSLQESAGTIAGTLNYASDLFERSTATRWTEYFISILKGMTRDPAAVAGRLSMLSEEELQTILVPATMSPEAVREDRLIDELFEEQARRLPDAPAVSYEGQSLSYAHLNSKANQLACYLGEIGVGPGQLVALYAERGFEMIVGILGILKAGCAYVPLDPAYPAERLAYMLRDSSPRVLLTLARLKDGVPDTSARLVLLDAEWSRISLCSPANPVRNTRTSSSRLAYVIYTSGSTGSPKGVMVEHGNVTRLFRSTQQWFSFNEQDVWTLFHSVAFDFSVWELWGALLYGGRVVVVPLLTARSADLFYNLVCEEGVTVLNQTPSAFAQLIDASIRIAASHSLRLVIFGGEALELRVLRSWVERHGDKHPRLVNMYGITETTVHVTYRPLTAEEISSARGSPIGAPIPDLRMYLLDRHRQPVPIGVAGEIHVGGAGVARGYLNRPELTAERFLADPFAAEGGQRMYKTGDLGRWQADGSLEYLGRNDHQVKIRGFRIELGEIEAHLLTLGSLKEAVVLAREDIPGDKRLVAYVIPNERCGDSTDVAVEALRTHLRSVLPEYMVPSAFVTLSRFPLTANGKLDRRALPAPERVAYGNQKFVPPMGELEQTLAQIWQQLLRVERVGRNDNFFELGGHSLLTVEMLERLRRAGLAADVRRVFESPTLADLARTVVKDGVRSPVVPPNLIPPGCRAIRPEMLPLIDLDPAQIERIACTVPGGVANVQDIYPLAPMQEGILFHHLLHEHGRDAYVVPVLLLVESRNRLEQLIGALQKVVDRHDILRTAVLWEQLAKPVQVVYRRATLPVEEVALDETRDIGEQTQEWVTGAQAQMDLRRAPLLRLKIAAHPDGKQWYALLQVHHITSDHVTTDIVVAEVLAYLDRRGEGLPTPVPFRVHVAQSLAYAQTAEAEEFFRRKLGDVAEATAPFGLVDVLGNGSRIAEAKSICAPELAAGVRAQARRLGVSAAVLFHAAWALVVARTTGRDDVVFGTVLLGRMKAGADAQRILGVLVNTLPLRIRLAGETARSLVEKTQRELGELLNHEQASLALAQRCSGLEGNAPLFSTLFNYRHGVPGATGAAGAWTGARGIQVIGGQDRTNYPITISVDDLGEGFEISAQTDACLSPDAMTGYLSTALRSLVDALEGSPARAALILPVLPGREEEWLIKGANDTQFTLCRDALVHVLFEEQVRQTPRAIAVAHDEVHLTYYELNARANRLARYLETSGVGNGDLVGIFCERSIDILVGVLATLKAGGAYVPLDPSYPAERLGYMLEDAAPKVVLTQDRLRSALPHSTAKTISLDEITGGLGVFSPHDLSSSPQPPAGDSLVYVIYTSGSTGRPKGTAMGHLAMVNLIDWHRRTLCSSQGRRVLQFAALSFDVAFQEIFSTLCTGGTLLLLDEWMRKDALALSELLKTRAVHRVFLPPLMLQTLAECLEGEGADFLVLQDVITAGEQLRISPEIVRLFERLEGCRLHNHYGPTETHVVTALTLTGSPAQWPPLPSIGRPLSNIEIYVLNGQMLPVPRGVAGEIYIGGAGVARGYLWRPDLTAERFLPDPFSRAVPGRLYKTGDLGRWNVDGALEYLGRNDHQVKIRGYRIEPGEIEAQLAHHEGVKEVAVIAREDRPGQKRLVAYITAGERRISIEELKAHCRAALPEHLVPSAFVILEHLPLTPNGKLDRRALPMPEAGSAAGDQYEAPRGELERTLAGIWQRLLGAENIGRYANFFELGGHSLLAVRAVARTRQLIGAPVTLKVLFDTPTLEGFAKSVQALLWLNEASSRKSSNPQAAFREAGVI